jgi:hypothetical protein
MSLLAGVAPRLATLVAQHGAAIAAGALSGALVGGTGVATGVIPTGAANGAPTRALLACPGSGPEVARISSGQPILVTARSADGAWLEVYVGEPGIDSGWASADALKLRDAASGLPVADCGTEVAVAPTPGQIASPAPLPSQIGLPTATPGPTAGPSPSLTPKPTVTPKPTRTPPPTPKPTPVPTPTPTPVPTSFKSANPPVVSELIAYGSCLPYGDPGYTESLAVTASDADAGDAITVTLHVFPPGLPSFDAPDFTSNGYGTDTWEGYFDATKYWTTSGVVKWSVTATDLSGNVTTVTSSSDPSDPSWVWYEAGTCPTP